jgi:4-diphosphocytidyl-2-C-methyl-D-erythritol kinase
MQVVRRSDTLQSLRVKAPAKINLHLRVALPSRDGFHPLSSWMCRIGLFDILTIEIAETAEAGNRAEAGSANGVELWCDDPSLPCDESNIVLRAARALAREGHGAGAAGGICPVSIRLHKVIPAGGGLGGGSSDAAAALSALNRLWKLIWPVERLAAFGGRFGSDVPFFFHGPSSICSGRGEIVRPIPRPKPSWALLILPPLAMPTARVYGRFDELKLGSMDAVVSEPPWREWAELNALQLLPLLVNDLEPAAFSVQPRLGQMRAELERELGRIVRMSGSGSTLFTLYDSQREAASGSEVIEKSGLARAVVAAVAPALEDGR